MRGVRGYGTGGFESQDVLEREEVVGHPVPAPLLHPPIKTLATIPQDPFLNPSGMSGRGAGERGLGWQGIPSST